MLKRSIPAWVRTAGGANLAEGSSYGSAARKRAKTFPFPELAAGIFTATACGVTLVLIAMLGLLPFGGTAELMGNVWAKPAARSVSHTTVSAS